MTAAPSPLWTASEPDTAVGLIGEHAWYFRSHSQPYGVFSRGLDGSTGPIESIGGLPMIGQPRYWTPIDGGILTKWDLPTRIDRTDGGLAVVWQAGPGRWDDSHIVHGDVVLTSRFEPAGVVALSLADGTEVWSTPLQPQSQGTTLLGLDEQLYVTWTAYDPVAPTPTILIPQRVRAFNPQTGEPAWTLDFDTHPGALAASAGVVVAAFDADMHFIDGATGQRTVVPTGQPPNIYPGLLVEDGVAYVALNEAVTAYGLDGTERWRHPVSLDGGPRLAKQGETLLVTTAHHSLQGIDAETGALQWEVGVGMSAYGLLTSAEMVLLRSSSGDVGVGLPVTLTPEEATITGTVSIDCGDLGPVHLAGTTVMPDAAGRYTATITAAGIVTIIATVAEPGDMEFRRRHPEDVSAVTVRLSGSGPYEAPPLSIRRCIE